MLGVYIHVPYCRVACPYCDFVKQPISGEAPGQYADAVAREISAFEGPREAQSLFFGGGTPSLLTPSDLDTIFAAFHRRFDTASPEISMEVNPDDVTEERAAHWRSRGVNRITIGVQSFDDATLKYLGRCHDAQTARRACDIIARTFENWGLDLIFGAPPIDAWRFSLAECVTIGPPHVSTYSLTFEQNTSFWRRRNEAIDPDDSLDLYRMGMDALAGWDHYEISNYARDGFQSAHNCIYWRNEEYAGFGPGAYSYLDGVRSRNAPHINRYLTFPGVKSETLSLTEDEIKVETLIQHFRTRCGITDDYYAQRFGAPLDDAFGTALRELQSRGLLECHEQGHRPTQKGYELNDEIGLALLP